MRKIKFVGFFRIALIAILALSLLLTALLFKQPSDNVKYAASHIQLLEDAPEIDLNGYVNKDVFYKLPSAVEDGQEISVIVTVDTPNLLDLYNATDKTMSIGEFAVSDDKSATIKDSVNKEKLCILSKLDDMSVEYKTGKDYSTLISGFELVIKAKDFEALCKSLSDGQDTIVSEVYNTCETELVENDVNVYATGIFNSSDVSYDGSGMVVAVLDTGLDSAHSAFSVDNFSSDKLGLTYDDVAAIVGNTEASKLRDGLSVDDVYINSKVPFGFDYADGDPDVYSTHNNHGTHVSGVIAGKDDVITGVAPNAQIVAMKIFSDVMDTARTSWILAALEDCVILGVDVINMSLGTACGFSRETDEEALNGVYDRIRDAGISVIAAASNSYNSSYGSEANGNLPLTSNPDSGTVGSPSTYKGVVSVASIKGVETPYLLYNEKIIYFIESTNGASIENKFCDTILGDEESVEFEYVTVPGVGRSADYTGLDVKGKIALVKRGDTTFEEKAFVAQAQGAVGLIIYNNVSGDIKMNVGSAALAVCSISQDNGEMLAAQQSGIIKISTTQTSGPFISDFSSWGPTPSLEIKPEITAHGGDILSAITGGGYDRLSGTSMACPNLAGVVVLLRQYVVENFPDIANDNVKVTALVNKLMMSTADIALNTNGLPYSVRKQGAGLANLLSSIETPAYITTYDKDGNEMDKPKLELGDDPDRTGVYELSFAINNFGASSLSYDLSYYVMTEGVSDTKTGAGKTTVTEEAYILSGAEVVISDCEGGNINGTTVTVNANETAKLHVTITLSNEDKEYLDKSFENGMYVEGYITLTAKTGTTVNLAVPYLAFYGDWTVAPMFDLDYYATNADELDDAIAFEDKTMADAYATRPIGGVYDDYVSYLGTYYFIQDPDDIVISANRDYIALSNQDGTIHSLRFVWAGLLRNAKKVVVTITDDTTGEVVFECEDTDVRKSYGDGGSIYPANIEIEFDTKDYNLNNNSKYTVKLVGYMDYDGSGLATNKNNTFEFPLVIDFEAPTVTDTEFYYEYDKTAKINRLYAKVGIYDNHYAMASQLGYVTMDKDENDNDIVSLKSFEQYLTPVYSKFNSVTYVTYELTDYIYQIKENAVNPNTFVLTCYDYALNIATYEIGLPDNYVDFYFDGLNEEITLSPNEIYTLEPLVYPSTEWAELLDFSSSKPSVVRVVNNKLIAVSEGQSVIRVKDPASGTSTTIKVNVLGEEDEGYVRYDKPVADVFRLDGYETLKAYYIVDSNDKELGDTGDIRFFEGNYYLSMYPSESVYLNYTLDAFFPEDTTLSFESGNQAIVTVNEGGVITAVSEGYSSVSVKILMNGKSTYYSETITIEVKDPYLTTGGSLTHYYGLGGLVSVPEDLTLTEIGSFAFSNFNYVLKNEEELAFDDAETSKMWYIGDSTITKVVLPEGIEKINSYAFANLTALEEIVIPSSLESIEYGAFFGCTSLEKITFSGENNLKIINKNAFENCNLQGTIDLSSVCVISDYAFAGNKSLEGFVTSDSLLSIGEYAFAGCKKLSDVTITATKVKYGPYAFTDCEALEEFYVNSAVLPEGMFFECKDLSKVTIGPDVNDIGPFAFRETAVKEFEIVEGNTAYKTVNANYILSADGGVLVAVSPTFRDDFSSKDIGNAKITSIGKGAFSHNIKIKSIDLPNVTKIADYGVASSYSLTTVTLGKLTDIGAYAFFESPVEVMPNITKDTNIGKYAFAATALKSVTIPDNTTVAEGVFSECMSLETVVIGNNVTLEKYAFNLSKDFAFDVDHYDEDGTRYFYYKFDSPITSLTIGDNAVIGENAFANASKVEYISLGKNAKIGYMAFYNNTSLADIDLSKATEIGDYAFSGDVYYVCYDDSMTVSAVSKEGHYIYTYHSPSLKTVTLDSAVSIGENAFSYCRSLTIVTLNKDITVIPEYAFAGCIALEEINLQNVVDIGGYAFSETAVTKADLKSAKTIGDFAFVYCYDLSQLTLSKEGTDMGEGAFSYCEALESVKNIEYSESIGDYAFAYSAIRSVDLSGAVSLGNQVFLKEEFTEFTVKLGDKLTSIGDNPFAMCIVKPFSKTELTEFNGVKLEEEIYTYNLSDTVYVIDGSLYCKVPTGLELCVYAGLDPNNATVADGTVRLTNLAFAGSDVVLVSLPASVESIGDKAFYGCKALKTVYFSSYDAPILEEAFDPTYYESFKHIPGTGDFGTYVDYEGNEVSIIGEGFVPYYMWNATDGLYSNVFYGANFIDYVGYVEEKPIMIRPVNGKNYDSYIFSHYFSLTLDGASAADSITLAAIEAINAIPDQVSYDQKDIVEKARAAYEKIATTEQQALVTNYNALVSAEQRIAALAPADSEESVEDEGSTDSNKKDFSMLPIGISLGALAVGAVALTVISVVGKKKQSKSVDKAKEATDAVSACD